MSKVFIEQITPLYIKAAIECGTTVNPVVLIAQAAHESSHGMSELAKNAKNIAGLKYSPPFNGEKYYKYSPEEQANGEWEQEKSAFCKFNSIEECIAYHAKFCISTDYRKTYYSKVLNAKTIEEQCHALAGTYATDSKYGNKLLTVIREFDLENYVEQIKKVINNTKGEDSMVFAKPKMIDRRKEALGYPGHGIYSRRSLSAIKNIVWHYTATKHEGYGGNIIKNHEYFWRNTHGWDIGGYHYYIDRQGNIFWNYDLEICSYGAGKGNPYCAHISLEASSATNYTAAQIKAREELTLWLLYTLGKTGEAVKGHFEIPGNSTSCPGYTVAQLNEFRKQLTAKLKTGGNTSTQTQPKSDRFVDLPDYKAPAKAFDELKVGQKVTIRPDMKAWYDPSNKEGIKPSKDFTGEKDTIEKVQAVNVGYSKRAYLLKAKRSWILEQDLVEARASWVAIPVKDDGTDKGEVKLEQDKPYVYIDGAYYDLVKR